MRTQSVKYGISLLDQTDFFAHGLGKQKLEPVDERESEYQTFDASLSMVDDSHIKIDSLGFKDYR